MMDKTLETQRLLEEAAAGILALGGSERDIAGEQGRSAFEKLRKGISRVGGDTERQSLLVEMPEKQRILSFVADFASHKRMYRNQASSVLVALLAMQEWEDAARGEPGLLLRLCKVDSKVEALFAEEVQVGDDAAAGQAADAPPPAAAAEESRSPAAPAPVPVEAAGGYPSAAQAVPMPAPAPAPAPATAPEPVPPKPLTPPADFHQFEQPRVRLPTDVDDSDGDAVSAVSKEESVRGGLAPPLVDADSAAARETQQMLRQAFEAMAKIDFQPDGGKRGIDAALNSFNALQKAVNRAHWEHARGQRAAETAEVVTPPNEGALKGQGGSQASMASGEVGAVVRVAGAADDGVHGFLVELASGERRGRFLAEDGTAMDLHNDAALKSRGAEWHELKRGEFLVQATGFGATGKGVLCGGLCLETSAHTMIQFNGRAASKGGERFQYRNQRGIVDIAFCDGTVAGVTGHTAEQVDLIASSLEGIVWEPRRTLMFLFNLSKVKAIYSRRIHSVAQMMMQVSAAFNEAARADEFLKAWIGACPRPDEPASVVSYGFASSLRWAVWDAGWHWVKKRQGSSEKAQKDFRRWKKSERELQASMEFDKDVLDHLLQAAWAAAAHCVTARFPEEKKGVFGQILGALSGANNDDRGPMKDEYMSHFAALGCMDRLTPDLLADLQWMMWNVAWYVANKGKGFHKDAREALVRAERHFQRAFRAEAQWRGVNLGGWFLLEPGPCDTFWESLPDEARACQCEWGCCEALGPQLAARLLEEHRRHYFCREDFERMREVGLSHVRLPFGSWCVVGPRPGEPYVGPCLDALDRALDQLEAAGLRVVLDLHGTVGGESAEPPCGHSDRNWKPRCWDPKASLAVLKVVAERYAGRVCVCGIGVCNEPSESIPARDLATFYEDAVSVIRQAGMNAGEVAVLLPIFTERRADEFLRLWEQSYERYQDVVWDVHLYQCFGMSWSMLTLERHMQAALDREKLLKSLPTCCVSEWSLAIPQENFEGFNEDRRKEQLRRFGSKQLQAYECATHGWFFWTWKDGNGVCWNLRDALEDDLLQVPGGGRASSVETP